MAYSESQTRKQLIDKQLQAAGWDISNRAQVLEEFDIKVDLPEGVHEPRTPYEGHQFSDYVLLGKNGKPVAVVEAKKTSKDAALGREQAKQYCYNIQKSWGGELPFCFYTNGHETYFWDLDNYPPRKVVGFPTLDDLERFQYIRRNRKPLIQELINTSIAGRDYQIRAIRAVLEGIEQKKRDFLLVMATGTGKTRTCIAMVDALMRAGHAEKVLFLVDRIALREQALGAFKEHLPNEPRWPNVGEKLIAKDRRIYVSTYPTMLNIIRDESQHLSPHYFDFIVVDESHRSIYNTYKEVLDYFKTITLGLTATPTGIIDHNTFKLFSCEDGVPTFAYTFEEAVNNVPPYLCSFQVMKIQTRFQMEGISKRTVTLEDQKKLLLEGKDIEEINFEGSQLEKQVINKGTNALIVKEFMEECIKDANGVTQFGYDANSNLLTVTDAKSQQTVYTYSNMNRTSTRKDPLLNTETYTYDNNGNLATVVDRKSQTTTYTYDPLNRRTKATFQDGTSTNYTYDAGNRITQVQEKDASNVVTATITRAYDGLDRLTQEVTAQGTLTYTYDNASRRATMTVAGQPTVNYTYDNANRLTHITQGASLVTIGYDDADRRASLTLPNGNSLVYTYNAASELLSLTYKQGATVIGDLTYTYDLAGNRIKTGGAFARTTIPPALTTASYNVNNQQTVFGANTLTYDLNGNLQTVTDTSGTATYSWNARHQLAAITVPGFAASFQYDSFGRRTGKTVQGVTTNFVYDGLNPVQEKNGATVTANLLTGLGLDEFFQRIDGVGTRALLPDALGSTIALGDSTGTLQTQYTYEPFGETSATGAASTSSYKYTGREDDGTGLYYYRARYYSPRMGRFVSEDPIGFEAGDMNVYAYVGNNPTNFADPWGLQAAIPFPGAPIPVPLPPIAIPGSPQNQQAVQATTQALQQLQNSVGALGDSLEDLLIMMAQRGEQNIDNEFSRQARMQPDPCKWLREQYNQAQDSISRMKIKAAQKFLGCRKRGGGKACE